MAILNEKLVSLFSVRVACALRSRLSFGLDPHDVGGCHLILTAILLPETPAIHQSQSR
jgi:hypothetical protein